MAKDIIVNVGERETRIAVIEDNKLVELHVERAERVVGSLYKCRVANVVAGMDAAFVDIGLERNAFLAVGDVLPMGEDGTPLGSEKVAPVPVSSDTVTRNASTAENGNATERRPGNDRRPRFERGRRRQGEGAGIPSHVPAESAPVAVLETLTSSAPDAAEDPETPDVAEAIAAEETAEPNAALVAAPEIAVGLPEPEAEPGTEISPAPDASSSNNDLLAEAASFSSTAPDLSGEAQNTLTVLENGETTEANPMDASPLTNRAETAEASGESADAVLATNEAIALAQNADEAAEIGDATPEFAASSAAPSDSSPHNAIAQFLALPTAAELAAIEAENAEDLNGAASSVAETEPSDFSDSGNSVPPAVLTDEADLFDPDSEDAAEIEAGAYLADEIADVDEDDVDDMDESSVGSGASLGGGRPGRDFGPRRNPNLRRSVLRQQRIRDVIKVGQELLVQVIKGPRSTKGARVSTRISLPGRYLVLMPEADNLGVSRKVEDAKERDRLKKIGERLREPGFGLIIRTEAEDKTETELRADMDFLLSSWQRILETSRRVSAPALVQQDLTLLYKTIRDVFGSDVNKLVIDDPAEYEKANELLERLSPKLKGRIHLYDGPKPIFDEFGLEQDMERLLRRKVFLKSGGSLVIDETEALTVIDVNTSKYTGGSNLAETIIKTNLDAANEIARQLRLRDIGGIIVIDFIDMNTQRDKQAVLKALESALKKDRSRTKISNLSPLGLVEMTRKRTGETLTGFMTDECPYCKGRGHLPSAESVSITLERDLRRAVSSQQNARKDAFVVTCHPEVAELLIGPEGATVEDLERQMERAIFVRSDEDAHVEKYTIEGAELNELERSRMPFKRAQIIDCQISRSLLKEPNRVIGWADGYLLDLDDGARFLGQQIKARLTDVRRSYAAATVIPGTNKPIGS